MEMQPGTQKQDTTKIFETQRAPGFLFNALSREYDAHITRCLKPLGLSARHWPILDQIYLNGGINQKELAEMCLRDPSTLVNIIDSLEKKGLVKRVADPKDRRAFKLYITEEGVEKRNSAYQITQKLFEQVTVDISKTEMDQLYNTCIRIYFALQEIET